MEATPNMGRTFSLAQNLVHSDDFKPDFVWGVATSAYQIEGAASQGGRDAIVNGDNGNNGTNSYYKYKEDVQMMKTMGVNAYRFSISWTRIFPGGRPTNGVNKEGVDYYNNLINELILCGITPYVTLFHWDTPETLEEEYMGFLTFYEPLNPEKQEDKDAAIRAIDFIFGWFMEPLFSGKYPGTMIKYVTGGRLPEFTVEQAKLIKGSYDFLGLNYYTSYYATTAEASQVPSYTTDSNVHQQAEGLDGKPIGPQGGSDWLYSYPLGLYKILQRIKHTYGDPLILITENGWPDKSSDDITISVACTDTQRIDYHKTHLQKLRDAGWR
ncbi:hypothetical protein L2E82_40411 [Cichorium intybus]|uniref:Uncharacterized protein n=1 Tax=Cichorium intybus TaxID=13427 RepID=A0ACB9ALA5_CICIN|nr:hypothetical protein L2E82_40411 [Cichorium intybus]